MNNYVDLRIKYSDPELRQVGAHVQNVNMLRKNIDLLDIHIENVDLRRGLAGLLEVPEQGAEVGPGAHAVGAEFLIEFAGHHQQ